jgi:hypothetical protein
MKRYPAIVLLGVILGVIGATLAAADPDADLIAYEPFTYPVGTSVEFLNGGTGWSGPWLWRTNFDGKGMVVMDGTRVVQGSLLYGDLDTEGNSLLLRGDKGTLELGRGLASLIAGRNGTRTYISFMARRSGLAMDTTVAGYRWGSNPFPRGASVRFWDSNGGERLSIGNTSNQPLDEWMIYGQGLLRPTGHSFSERDSLVVVRLDHNGDAWVSDDVTMWVNPDLQDGENPETADLRIFGATASRQGDSDALDYSNLSWISPFAGDASGDRLHAEWYLDELRIGKTFASVTPTFPRWSRFLTDEEGVANTGHFLKWINVAQSPWVWSYVLGAWLYLPEESVTAFGGWAYLPVEPISDELKTDAHWGPFTVDAEGLANTGSFMGWVQTAFAPWIWSYAYDTWAYIEDSWVASGLTPAYILDTNAQTLPLSRATRPEPVDGDGHVDGDDGTVLLTWRAGSSATRHHVFLGDDADAVGSAGSGSELYFGSVDAPEFEISGLDTHRTWYWRVDEESADGERVRGQVWQFRLRQLAFPGAEGYGRFARGGRGGRVIAVTNLNDSGPGSLRAALEEEGPRIIVFNVGGMITLESQIYINDDAITIAGQTAPGDGICLRQHKLGLSGSEDVIIRFLRVRPGDIAGITLDGMGMQGSNHCIIDHCSISWTIDEAFSSRSAKNITLQRTLISEALNVAGHKNYPAGTEHGYAASISGLVGSFHHNLLAHCAGRNWSLAGGLDPTGRHTGWLDIRNNVVYNWKHRTTDGGAQKVNFVANYYKPGPASRVFYFLNPERNMGFGPQDYFVEGNILEGRVEPENQLDGITEPEPYENFLVDEPFFESYVNTQPAAEAYKIVLSDVGVTIPAQDNHDQRIITETLSGETTYRGSISGLPGIPDSQDDVGGWDNYREVARPADWDGDGDGLPGWWEVLNGTNPSSPENDFSDTNADPDGDGFTLMDDYLAWMALPRWECSSNGSVEVDLRLLARGFTDSPVFIPELGEGGSLNRISEGLYTFHPSPGFNGLTRFRFTVADAEGHQMTREVGIHVHL